MAEKIKIASNMFLSDVFSELEKGNLKIPKFQRGYVWTRPQIVKLLNSIYNSYPIGSFFMWITTGNYSHFCHEIVEFGFPKEPRTNQYTFILDGQQRITSLYLALKGKTLNGSDFTNICFNLEKKHFVIQERKSEKHNIPSWKLYDQEEFSKVYSDYNLSDPEKAKTWLECFNRFSVYPLSVINTFDMELDDVVDIFERINQGGKKLSLFDLVHASTWSEDFDLRDKINAFNNDINKVQFGEIADEVFTQSLSLNVFGDCKNANQLELTTEACKPIWNKTVECIKLALDFVRTLGAKYADIIPYPSFLAILQYYFYKSNLKGVKYEHQKYIQDWYWSSTFSSRYTSSTLSKMKDDADWIYRVSQDEKVDNVFGIALSVREIIKIRMNIKSAVKNGILCLYALQNPVDFDNGTIVTLNDSYMSKANAKEKHHFFPFSLRSEFNTDEKGINSIVNLAFISQRLNREILNKKPSVYYGKYKLENPNISSDLNSHFIDDNAIIAIKNDDYAGFLKTRAQIIYMKIMEVTAESQHEETDDNDFQEEIYETDIFSGEEVI